MATDDKQRGSRATEAFFGRRKGRPLRSGPAASMGAALPSLRLDLGTAAPADLSELFEASVSGVRLEIGYGGGEHLHHEAKRHPNIGFVGVEPFVNGVASFIRALESDPLPNVRVYDDDATQLLDWLPDGCLDGIDLFYPDPWPKKKHWKRRFVSAVNLDRFARVLKPSAKFRFASDIDTYVNWTLLHCRAHEAFEWQAGSSLDWKTPYEAWPSTRYEAKALREGRVPAYLTFLRR